MVDDEDIDATEHIEECHERHQHAAHLRDGLHATDDDGCAEDGDHRARDVRRDAILVFHERGDGVRLHRTSDAERGEGGEEGEEDGEPLPAQSLLQGIHRTAEHSAPASLHTIFHGKQSLCIFGGDTKHTCEPAPEHGSRTTEGDGCGDTDDVARADGGGEGCGKGTKLRYVARGILVPFHREFDGLEYLPLRKAQADGQEDMSSQQEYNHWPSPEE